LTLVVDTSVALKWFKQEPDSALAEAVATSDALTAPSLLLAELANACWLAARVGLLSDAQLADMPRAVRRYVAMLVSIEGLMPRALHVARALDHPAYDCSYLALAEREAATLVTADGRFARRVAGTPWSAHVHDLASFAVVP
jgi:predicted nucleic acid-binding protein